VRVWKKGDGESLACPNYLDNAALLKPTGVHPKHSSKITDISVGKVPSISTSTSSKDITSDSLSSQRLESTADLQPKEKELKD